MTMPARAGSSTRQAAARIWPAFLTDREALARLLYYSCAVIGAQRLLLHGLDAYVCLVMAGIAVYYFPRDRRQCNTALVLAIFLSVDNGAFVYAETAAPLRYVLYLAALGVLFRDFRTDPRRLFIAAGALLVPLVITLFNLAHVDSATLRGNIILAILAVLVLARSPTALENAEIDWDRMGIFFVLFALSELPNILFFYHLQETGYLNYNGTKSLLVFGAFYYLRNRPLPLALPVIGLISYVILFYQTRMIVLSFMLVLLMYVLGRVVRLRRTELLLACLVGGGAYLLFTSDIELDGFKIVYTFQHALAQFSLEDFLKTLDPIRYYELRIFMERDWFHLLFGNGLGAGLFDYNRYFSFIPANNTAFSIEELQSGYMYHFHDVWNDIGLRFGLVYLVAVLTPLFIDVHVRSGKRAAAAMTLIVLIFSAFFSTAGLICIALLGLGYRAERQCEKRETDISRLPEKADVLPGTRAG
jgi:hypothetical protein